MRKDYSEGLTPIFTLKQRVKIVRTYRIRTWCKEGAKRFNGRETSAKYLNYRVRSLQFCILWVVSKCSHDTSLPDVSVGVLPVLQITH